MSKKWPGADSGVWSRQYVNFIYIPGALLLFGTAIIKTAWLPYAVALVGALGAWQYLDMQPKTALHKEIFRDFELEEKTIVSHNVAIYKFKLPTPQSILGLPIGQHISVSAMIEGQEKAVTRSYTPITSDEVDKGYFKLMIKSYPTGNVSKHMAQLKIGQTLQVRGPKGAMRYTPNMVTHLGMIAGGSGITPMLQIIKAINRGRKRGDVTQVDLIYANVNKEDILLKEDLDALNEQDSKFKVHYVLNNPPEGWTGEAGFVTADIIKAKFPAPANDKKVLICGPPPMVSAMKKAIVTLGYEKPRPVSKLEDQVFCF